MTKYNIHGAEDFSVLQFCNRYSQCLEKLIDTQLTYSHTWGFKYYRNNAGLCTDPKKLPSMKGINSTQFLQKKVDGEEITSVKQHFQSVAQHFQSVALHFEQHFESVEQHFQQHFQQHFRSVAQHFETMATGLLNSSNKSVA